MALLHILLQGERGAEESTGEEKMHSEEVFDTGWKKHQPAEMTTTRERSSLKSSEKWKTHSEAKVRTMSWIIIS